MPTPVDYEAGRDLAHRNVCAECSGRLSVAWGGFWGIGGWALRCGKDASHAGVKPKTNTRKLFDPDTMTWKEYDVTTQREIVPLPKTEQGMLQRLKEAEAIGLWPQKMTPQQAAVLAQVALAYGLDPFMREIMPYQGAPYITIGGRRRKDEAAGHYPSISFRFLTPEEKQGYEEAGAIKAGDLCKVCILRTERGNTVEGFAKVTKLEREGRNNRGDGLRSPVVAANPIEMVEKRAERRAREMAYGPIPLPQGLLPSVQVYEEGDVIEGEAHEIEEGHIITENVEVDPATGEIRPARLSDTGEIFAPDEELDTPPVNLPTSCSSMVLLQQLWAKMGWGRERVEEEVLDGQTTADFLATGDNTKGKMTNALYIKWRQKAEV